MGQRQDLACRADTGYGADVIPALVEIPAPPPRIDVWECIEALCPATPDPTDRASDMDWQMVETLAGIEPVADPSGDWSGGRHG